MPHKQKRPLHPRLYLRGAGPYPTEMGWRNPKPQNKPWYLCRLLLSCHRGETSPPVVSRVLFVDSSPRVPVTVLPTCRNFLFSRRTGRDDCRKRCRYTRGIDPSYSETRRVCVESPHHRDVSQISGDEVNPLTGRQFRPSHDTSRGTHPFL